ncbi:MAG: helix-turn-helix domain-containing protein [Acutalibacteraceae bacterium]
MNRIRELREDRDLRQSDVAAATGIDQRTLSNYETEKTNPDSYAIIKLCDFFDVSADYLIGRDDKKTNSIKTIENKITAIQKELNTILNNIKNL